MSDKNNQNQLKWSAIRATAGSVGFVGIDSFSITGTDIDLNINQSSSNGTMVNFEAQNLTVDSLVFDMPESNDNFISFEGTLNFKLFDFINFSKHISFTQTFKTVALDDGTTTTIELHCANSKTYINVDSSKNTVENGCKVGTGGKVYFKFTKLEIDLNTMTIPVS